MTDNINKEIHEEIRSVEQKDELREETLSVMAKELVKKIQNILQDELKEILGDENVKISWWTIPIVSCIIC